MKNCLFPFFALIFLACNNNPKKTNSVEKKGSSSTVKQSDKLAIASPAFNVLIVDKNEQTFKDSIKGTVVNGLCWQDAEGEHRVLFTTIPVQINQSGQQSGAIYAYCFIKNATGWKKKWEVKDRIEACQVDATCEFLPNSFTITDNDSNNLGEVTFLYKISCKGDVSPDDKKLIMYEGTNKYAIRGTTIIQHQGTKAGGDKKIDASFGKAAKPLLDFANRQWHKFGITNY